MLIILSPNTSCVLGPSEIVGILDLICIAFFSNFIENFNLSDMDCHDCLNSGSELFVHIFKTHFGKISKNTIEEFLLFVKLHNFLFIASFEAFSNVLCPENLDTKKSNLRWISKRVISSGHRVAILSSSLAFYSD